MVKPALLEQVFALPVVERFELLERLQDNLREEQASMPLSDWQRAVLADRLDDFVRNPTAGSSWDDVDQRLRARPRTA